MAKRPKKPSEQVSKLSEALQFLSLLTKKTGAPNETHIKLVNKWAVAFNGIIAAGQPINEDLSACPHAQTLPEALTKCGLQFTIEQPAEHKLVLKSGKFKANIPCINTELLYVGNIDNSNYDLNERFMEGLGAINIMPNENGQQVHLVSLLMNGQSIIATNGTMILEYWHGLDLPSGLAIPKDFATALVKSKKKSVGLGCSKSTITVHFDDRSWLRTQLYADVWPDVRPILNRPCEPEPMPADFFQGLVSIVPFSTDGLVHFGNGLILSHASEDAGASYAVPGLQAGPIFPADQLKLCQPYMQKVDWQAKADFGTMAMFFGEKIRGAIMSRQR